MKGVSRRRRSRGATTVEFAFVGIPLMFVMVSIFEISRGMWMWETVAHAVRSGTRYAAVHGLDCVSTPNTCGVTVGQIAQQVRDAGVGLDPNRLQVTVSIVTGGSTSSTVVSNGPRTLGNMQAETQSFSNWSTISGGSTVQAASADNDVVIVAVVPFNSALAMFWPGKTRAQNFSTINLSANSRERIQF